MGVKKQSHKFMNAHDVEVPLTVEITCTCCTGKRRGQNAGKFKKEEVGFKKENDDSGEESKDEEVEYNVNKDYERSSGSKTVGGVSQSICKDNKTTEDS